MSLLPSLALFSLAAAVPAGTVMVVPPEPPSAPGTAGPAALTENAWVAETVADLLPRALARAGVPTVTREDRLRGQAALEIPVVPLTRATSIRLAEALGASRLVVGSYVVEGPSLTLSLRLLDAERGTLGAPAVSTGPLEGLSDLVQGMAWDIALAGTTAPGVSREEFMAGHLQVRYPALRTYGQGLFARSADHKAKLMRRALALDPTFHEARLALGRLQIEAGEFSAGHDTLARIPAASPHARAARFLQGVAHLEVGRYQQAAALYARLAEESATPAVLNNQALAVLRGRLPDPRPSSLLRRAVEMEPDSLDLAFNLAWALLIEGDTGASAFFLRDIMRREPLEGHARLVLVWALRRAGRGREADEEWKGVVTLAPAYEGQARPDLGRRFERILPAERMLVLARGSRTPAEVAAGLIGKAERLGAAGDTGGAVRELERAAYLNPLADGIHLRLARAYRAQGQRDRAINEYMMTLWDQDEPAVRAELAAVLKEMGRLQEARAEAQKVLRQEPQNAAALKVLQP